MATEIIWPFIIRIRLLAEAGEGGGPNNGNGNHLALHCLKKTNGRGWWAGGGGGNNGNGNHLALHYLNNTNGGGW